MRLGLLFGALALALLIGVLALQVPSPRGADAPAVAFSSARAMVDVRAMAREPHPVGSAAHERVRGYLFGRMVTLGLNPTLQTGALSPGAIARLRRWGETEATTATNIVGVLPGRDPPSPAVLLMAHYDSVADSPGAADDATGVAALLETVRAIQARGPADRTLILLLTDAEELNLDGARVFFSEHPARDRIGAVVNVEARGGGGRALMFETGPGNGPTIDLFAAAARRADGGPTSNSLAVLVYESMPNGSDFTIPRSRGAPGVNLAFIGRPAQYHSPDSTAAALDQGSVQHIGSQALEAADAFLRAPALPVAGENRVYADILGQVILGHAPAVGWSLLAIAAGLVLFAFWGGRHATGLTFADVGRGALAGVWVIAAGLVLTHAVRLLAGPISSRIASADAYYVLLRRLPWIEGGAALAILAVALVALAGRDMVGRRVLAGTIALAAVAATALGGVSPLVLGAAVVAIGLSLWSEASPRGPWGAWLGLIVLVLVLGGGVQAVAPTAAFLLIWPGLLAALAAAVAALIGARLQGWASLLPAAAVTVIGGAWIVSLAHPVFLGIGMDLPGVLAPLALLTLMLARPLASTHGARGLAGAACACLILACAVSTGARIVEPAVADAPGPG